MMTKDRKSRLMFDLPVGKDWLFYVFCFFVLSNFVGALNRVQESGGVNTSTYSLLSGAIDAIFGVVIAWVMVAPIYWIRRLVRRLKPESQD
jgi:hypothetical protein